MKRRILSLVMALCMMLTLLPMNVFATGDSSDNANLQSSETVVARIGETPYTSLQKAIEAVQDGETITLIADIDLGEAALTASGAGTKTIDFNGFTVTSNCSGTQMLYVTGGCALVLKDSTEAQNGGLKATKDDGALKNLIRVETDGTLVIESGTYYQDASVDGSGMIDSRGDEIITIKGGNFHLDNIGSASNGSPWLLNTSGQNTANIIVTGGTFNADVFHQYYIFEVKDTTEVAELLGVPVKAAKNNGDGTWTVVDAVAYVDEQHKSGNWYTQNTGYATLEEAVDAADEHVNGDKGNTVTLVKDAEVTGDVAIGAEVTLVCGDYSVVLADKEATLTAVDGLNVTTNVANSKVVYEDGVYKVAAQNFVAQIGETKYESLKEAIDACTNGETVKLIADITYGADDVVYAHGGATGFGNYDQYNPSIVYVGGTEGATPAENQPSKVNAVLDLNGHIITNNANAYLFLIMDNAKVTFTDSVGGGKVVGNNENYPVIWACGTDTLVTIESGTYQTASPLGLIHSTHSGDLVIEGGHFSTTADDASLLLMINSQKYNNPNYFLKGVATLTVKGGTFVGFNPEKVGDDYGASSIEDIKFVDAVPLGYEPQLDSDGNYGVEATVGYEIYDSNDLYQFAAMANAGNNFSGKTVKLMADIDLGGMTWTPIKNFLGTFDGGKHTISNYHLDATKDHSGFFYKINFGNGTAIKDLTLSDITATVGNYYVGALAYFSFAVQDNITIRNFTVTTTSSEAKIGGYAGWVEWGHIRNCTIENMTVNAENGAGLIGGLAAVLKADSWLQYNNIDVKGMKVNIHDTDGTYAEVGGLIGQTQTGHDAPVFTNCDITDLDVTASGKVTVGGFIARPGAHTTATNCTTQGKIDVTGVTSAAEAAGGFFGNLGWNNNESSRGGHKLTNCSADVDITTKVAPAGGFVGSATNEQNRNMAVVFNGCSASGDITCIADGTANIGGFAGDADRGTYTNCSASGTITNNGTGYAGQFIGAALNNGFATKITDCTYTGSSTGLKFIGNTADNVTIETSVAQVGETKYKTLKEAVEAANAIDGGATVILLTDAEVAEPINVTGAVTIDGKDKTIKRSGDYTGKFFAVQGSLVLKDVELDAGAEWTKDQNKINADIAAGGTTEIFKSGMTADQQKDAAFAYIALADGAILSTERLISVNESAKLEMTDVNVQNYVGETTGLGIIEVQGGKVAIAGSIFQNNFAWRAGGDDHGGIIRVDSGEVTMASGVAIQNNIVIGANGSLIGIVDGVVDMSCDVTGNVAVNSNGLIQASGYNGTVPKLVVNGGKLSENTIIPGVNNGFASVIYNRTGEFTMNSGEITNNVGGSWPAFNMRYATETNLNGGTISGNTSMSGSEYTLHLRGGASVGENMVIEGNVDVYGGSDPVTNEGKIKGDVRIRFNGTFENTGTVEGKMDIPEGYAVEVKGAGIYGTVDVPDGATLTIYEGTFKQDVTEYCAEGYKAVDNGNGTWTVEQVTYVTLTFDFLGITETYTYPGMGDGRVIDSLQDLINEYVIHSSVSFLGAPTNAKLTVNEDVVLEEALKISTECPDGYGGDVDPYQMTLDLNGHTITGMVENYVELTVVDGVGGGEIDGGDAAAIDNYGKVTIQGGQFAGAVSAVYNNQLTEGQAEVVIDGGVFTAPGNDCATIENRYGKLTVNDGEITATANAGYAIVDTCGVTTINNGKISAANGTAVETYQGEIVIKDGEFIGKVIVENQAGTVEVKGGKLVSNTPEYYYGLTIADGGTTTLYGGTFERDYTTAEGTSVQVAPGYEVVENDDGTYTVQAWDLEIWNKNDLLTFARMANAGETFSGKTVQLMADVDLGGDTWTPIASFAGEFDGNGERENGNGSYTISNFHIDATAGNAGFFGTIEAGEGERVHDLTLSGVTADVGAYRFGTLANYVKGIVNRVTVKDVTVTTTHTNAWVGGMCAFMSWPWMNDCTVEDLEVKAAAGADLIGGFACVLQKNSNMIFVNNDVKGFKVDIKDTDASGCGVGGFVTQTQRGWENPKVINSDITGIHITASGLVDVGGFIAWPGAHTIAENCTTAGTINATGITGDNFVGGFFGNLGWNADLGQMGHVVKNCTASVNIFTNVAPAGGFVGSATNSNNASMYATFKNCTATGNVSSAGSAPVGGFAGEADRGVYKNCSATGIVMGTTYAGGFIGHILDVTPKYDHRYPAGTRDYGTEEITISSCSATNVMIIGAADKTAGIVGYIDKNTDVTLDKNTWHESLPEYNPVDAEVTTYVAQIGEGEDAIQYATLQAAIDAAAVEGDTITVLTDINLADVELQTLGGKYNTLFKVTGKTVTIDLAGKTISGAYTGDSMLVGVFSTEEYGHLTLTGNGTVDVTATNTVYGLIVSYDKTSSIIVENGTYKLDKASDSLIYTGGDENVTIKDGTFTLGNVDTGSNGSPWIFNAGGQNTANIIVIGGTFNADVFHQYYIFEVKDTTEVAELLGVPVKAAKNNGDGTWTVVDAVAYVDEQYKTDKYYTQNTGYATLTEAVGAAGEHVNGDKGYTVTLVKAVELTAPVDATGVKIEQKEFAIVLADKVATLTAPAGLEVTTTVEGYDVAYEDGTYKLVAKKYVAQIGETKYETLQAAVEAAQPGETVMLISDIDLTEADLVEGASHKVLVDVVGKDITLDMNGKKISVVHEDAFTNDYIVAVIRVADGAGLTVTGNGTIDVKVLAENPDVAYMFWKRGTTGHLTIENGTYHMNDSADSMVYTNGNEIVNIKGGTWTLDSVNTRGDNDEPWIFNVQGAGDNHVTVTGGTFNADINRQKWSNEVLVPETYYTVANADGTYTVKNGAVAYVNTGMTTGPYYAPKDIGYATFEDAVAAAVNYKDGPITLLANVQLTASVDAGTTEIVQNNFAIELASKGAALTAPEGLTVTTGVDGYKVVYEDGVYKLVENFVAKYTDADGTVNYFETVQEAINAAKNAGGGVVTMITDSSEGDILVRGGVTLDLNGNTLTAETVTGFAGSDVIDGSKENSGLLVVQPGNVALAKDNAQIPVWNANNGYIFTQYQFNYPDKGVVKDETAGTVKFRFIPFMEAHARNLLEDGASDNDLKIIVRLTWNTANGAAYQDFVYNEDQVKDVITANGESAFTMTISGFEKFEGLSISAAILSGTDVAVFGEAFTINE